MGILNITQDSFYDGNEDYNVNFNIPEKYKFADIIDIGCESSRPGSSSITDEEEINRLSMIDLTLLHHKILSIDSCKYSVIKYGLDKGFNIINDISAGGPNNINMTLALEYNVPIILMHMKGTPFNMQKHPHYQNIMDELLFFFEKKINEALKLGLTKKQIILDPGIGFGKRIQDNDIIINNIKRIKSLGFPIVIGISRKSFLSVKNDLPKDRLEASLSVLSLAVYNGADIVRVHDIKITEKILNIIDRIKNQL